MSSKVSPVTLFRRVVRGTRRPISAVLNGPSRDRSRVYARAMRAHPSDPGARVVIFAQGRSGTTLLESLVCSTGLFVLNDEPLIGLGRGALFPSAYVRGLSRDPSRQGIGGNYICHVKPDHLDKYRVKSGRAPADMGAFVRSLVRDHWHIVHVHRENIIKQVLSEIVGKAHGQWHKRDDRPEFLTVHIDRDDFLSRLSHNEAMRARERAVLDGLPHTSLNYERDLLAPTQHEKTVDMVLDHVNLTRSGPVSTPLRKMNTRPTSEVVENYEELLGWVRDLRLGDLLD